MAEVVAAGFDLEGFAPLGGASAKFFVLSRCNGRRYIYKPGEKYGRLEPHRAHADCLAARVAALLFEPGDYIPVGLARLDYGKGKVLGSVQPYLDDATDIDYGWGGDERLLGLSDDDLRKMQQEQVLDWLISNHDAHGGQWVRRADGRVLGIDKTQACRYLLHDRLDHRYHPNACYGEDHPIYYYIFEAARRGFRSIDPGAIVPVLERAARIDTATFLAQYDDYLEVAGLAEEKRRALAERKRGLTRDFGAYYTRMLGREVVFA
jgi:hypothetical protein